MSILETLSKLELEIKKAKRMHQVKQLRIARGANPEDLYAELNEQLDIIESFDLTKASSNEYEQDVKTYCAAVAREIGVNPEDLSVPEFEAYEKLKKTA